MIGWLRRLFGERRAAVATPRPPSGSHPAQRSRTAPPPDDVEPAARQGAGPSSKAAAVAGIRSTELAHSESVALGRIERAIDDGRLEMPSLSPAAVRILGLVSDRNVEIDDLVGAISGDPVLTSELLKIANSALFGTQEVESLNQAITRLGLRRLRSMVYATSMRSLILGYETLTEHAAEVWRQAQAAAAIAHAIAPRVGIEAEKAFMIGLLHDIGRIPLLALLNSEGKAIGQISDNLVGRVFNRFHERAGAGVAEKWQLSEELIAVAGCHHLYERNTEHARSAALASLSHRLDLGMALGADDQELAGYPEMEFFGMAEEQRAELVGRAQAARDESVSAEPASAPC